MRAPASPAPGGVRRLVVPSMYLQCLLESPFHSERSQAARKQGPGPRAPLERVILHPHRCSPAGRGVSRVPGQCFLSWHTGDSCQMWPDVARPSRRPHSHAEPVSDLRLGVGSFSLIERREREGRTERKKERKKRRKDKDRRWQPTEEVPSPSLGADEAHGPRGCFGACFYVSMYVCACMCLCLYIFIYTYTYIYIYAHPPPHDLGRKAFRAHRNEI